MGRALVTDLAGGDRRQEALRAVQAGIDRYGGGDLAGAKAELERALRLWPEHPRARLYLGWVLRCLRVDAEPADVAQAGAPPGPPGADGVGPPLVPASELTSPPSAITAPPAAPGPALVASPPPAAAAPWPPVDLPHHAPPAPVIVVPPARAPTTLEMPEIEIDPTPEDGLGLDLPPGELVLEGPAADTPRPGADELEEGIPLDLDDEPAAPAGEAALDLDADGMGSEDLNLSDLVAQAEEWSHGQEPPSLDEVGLITVSDELAGEPALARAAAPRDGSTLSSLLGGTQAPVDQGSGFSGVLGEAPAASGLSDLLGGPPAAPAASGLSDLLGGPPAAPAASGLSDLLGDAIPLAPDSGLSSLPEPPPPAAAVELSAVLSNLPVLDDAAEPGDLALEAELDNLELRDDESDAPSELLLEEYDLDLVSHAPPPAAKSPLIVEDLFAEVADPAPSEPSRPLTTRPVASDTPDFVVDFDDVLAVEAENPGTFPPPPGTFPPPPPRSPGAAQQLEEAQRALSRGDTDTAYRLAEEIIARCGGDASASSLRPYSGQLAALYEGMLGSLERLPRAGRMPKDLEPASAFLLSLLDGSMTLEDALTVSGMERLRGARTLVGLVRRGLVSF